MIYINQQVILYALKVGNTCGLSIVIPLIIPRKPERPWRIDMNRSYSSDSLQLGEEIGSQILGPLWTELINGDTPSTKQSGIISFQVPATSKSDSERSVRATSSETRDSGKSTSPSVHSVAPDDDEIRTVSMCWDMLPISPGIIERLSPGRLVPLHRKTPSIGPGDLREIQLGEAPVDYMLIFELWLTKQVTNRRDGPRADDVSGSAGQIYI